MSFKPTKDQLKKALFYRQVLGLYHRLRNRDTLTVVVFHRVIAPDDPRWADAQKDWTVSDTVFEQCLIFFRRHYNLVTLRDLIDSMKGKRRLPPRSLLVTFDDGFADNEEYALPILRRHGVPAVIFITSAFIDRETRPWTEDLLTAERRGLVSREEIAALHRSLYDSVVDSSTEPQTLLKDICNLSPALTDDEVEALCSGKLERPLDRIKTPAQMLSSDQVRHIHAAGIEIGAHGRTHVSMPLSSELGLELNEPRRTLSELLGLPTLNSISALAFPYGDHSANVVRRALDEGYQLCFTFQPAITPLRRGRLTSNIIDRVNVSGPTLAPDGVTTPERLSRSLFFLPHAKPSVPSASEI